jgi:hypothetical protein
MLVVWGVLLLIGKPDRPQVVLAVVLMWGTLIAYIAYRFYRHYRDRKGS